MPRRAWSVPLQLLAYAERYLDGSHVDLDETQTQRVRRALR